MMGFVNLESRLGLAVTCPRAAYLLGRLPQDVPDTSAAPQAVTQHCDNAHEQRVTRPLLVLNHHRRRLHDNGG